MPTLLQKILGLVLACFALLFVHTQQAQAQLPFKRTMNIGNALDAPRATPWDVQLQDEYFTIIKQAGFDGVRLPVRFSDYAGPAPYYVLDAAFMHKMDNHIKFALDQGLYVILDLHHFEQLMQQPEQYHKALLAIWWQLSERYKDYSDKLVFEVLNEPTGQLQGEVWNAYLNDAVGIIRRFNPDRYIIFGPDSYNTIEGLSRLTVPQTNKLVLTFHYYLPAQFTHQGMAHVGMGDLRNVKWQGTQQELEQLQADFLQVKQFADAHNLPVLLGEFGVSVHADKKSRASWTYAVRKQAEQLGFSWSYWEFASQFGAFDAKKNHWDNSIKNALLKD